MSSTFSSAAQPLVLDTVWVNSAADAVAEETAAAPNAMTKAAAPSAAVLLIPIIDCPPEWWLLRRPIGWPRLSYCAS